MPIYQQMWILQIFSHFSRFFKIFFTILPPKMASFGTIQLVIIANIFSYIMSYQYAKFHDFIKKFTIDVIFRWL